MKVKCHCCDGSGEVEDDPPLKLTPMQDRIYKLVTKYRLDGHELVSKLYGHLYDGGPDYALDTVHVHINKMNKALIPLGKRVVSTHRGPGGHYRVVNVV